MATHFESANYIAIDPIKREFTFEDVDEGKVDTEMDSSSKTSEYEYQEAPELESDQFSLMTDTQTSVEGNVKLENDGEASYTNENLVGAFYEINYKTEDVENADGGPEYSFLNGESQIVFADGTVLGEDCVLQLVDPSVPESVNGSHTLRCTDGTEIQINIVKKESSIDTTRDIKTSKVILPCNSSSIKTYPPSNKNSVVNTDPTPSGNTSLSYFSDLSDRTEAQIGSEANSNSSFNSIKKSFKSKINGLACSKCKREFTKPHQLDWHCETFCGAKPFRCYTCNKRFSKDRFNYHVSICRDKQRKNRIKRIAESVSTSDSD